MKITIEGDWKGEGFVEFMLPEEQDSSWKLALLETAYNLSGEVQAIYVENHSINQPFLDLLLHTNAIQLIQHRQCF